MENGELIFPSFFAPAKLNQRQIKTLAYMPSLNCCLFVDNDSSLIQVLDLTSRSLRENLVFEDREFSHVIALSSDDKLLASDAGANGPLPTQLRLSRLPRDDTVLKPDICLHSCCIEPDFDFDSVTCIKFFPDNRKIFVTGYQATVRRGNWLTEYEVPENLWSHEDMKKNTIQSSSACSEEAKVEVPSYSSEKSNEKGNIEVQADNTEEMTDCFDPNEKVKSKENAADPKIDRNSFSVNCKTKEVFKKSGGSDEEVQVQKTCQADDREHGEIAGKNLFCGDEKEERVVEEGESSESDIGEEHDSLNESSWEDNKKSTRGKESDESDEETSRTRNNVTLVDYHLNVQKQGYSIPPAPSESSSDSDREFHTVGEYYDWRYGIREVDESNLFTCWSGFYCLAISPDTTRLLTGNHDGEVFIIDEDSFDVLQHIQACIKDTVVSGCYYNPVFAHDEFVTCGGTKDNSILRIWCVKNLEDGVEKVSCAHSLSLQSMPVNCCYSPDGKLVAVTCDSLHTYVVCPQSGDVMYTLTYENEFPKHMPGIGAYSFGVTLFAGRTCQVLTTPNQKNYSIAIWSLPVVYSLETLCFLIMRATVNYKDIDALHLPNSLKLRLKYLFV